MTGLNSGLVGLKRWGEEQERLVEARAQAMQEPDNYEATMERWSKGARSLTQEAREAQEAAERAETRRTRQRFEPEHRQ
jgi:hypothetical protein